MRRFGAFVCTVACLLLAAGQSALAEDAPRVEACATQDDRLGLSRIVEVDTDTGPMFGRTHAGAFDFLKKGEVILTFDDGPLRPYTRAVLKALDEHCTKATFFMVGRMAVSDPAMVREVAKHGHTIAAHTWSHARLQGMEFDKAKDEIEMGFSAVASALKAPIAPFFRFPYLRTSKETVAYLKSRSIAAFAIDVDSRDFETKDGEKVKAKVLADLDKRKKGILLFHDIQPSTASALKGILDELKARGYKVVHVVPKHPASTLAEYDTRAQAEIANRKLALKKKPLASRSVVWSNADSKAGGEVLPWKHVSTASNRDDSSKAQKEP